MRHINKIVLIGNVGKSPEFSTHGETKVAKFTLATTRKWKDKQSKEIKEKTIWHDVVCFGNSAEYARDYVVVGAECYVEGEQENSVFTKDDGNKVYSSQVVATEISANRYEKKSPVNTNNSGSSDGPPLPNENDFHIKGSQV